MEHAVVEISGQPGRRETAVVLPCGLDQFSQFIASLLGRPQELTGFRVGPFAVTKEEALQVHHLLVQRVQQQHGTSPLQVTARISYDNGTSVLLNSIEDFEQYHEVRALRSVSLLFTWTFLLNFPGQPTPEKQEVEFGFGAKPRRVIDADMPFIVTGGGGTLNYRIKHTARTWGSDLESMFTHYMDTVVKPPSSFRQNLRKYCGWIGAGFGLIMFVFFMGGFVYVNNHVLEDQSALLLPALGDKASVGLKLDRIITYLSVSRESLRSIYSTLYVIASVIGSIVGGIAIGTQAETSPPSGILLTKRAQQEYDATLKKFNHSLWGLCLSVVGALVIGVGVNLVYDFAVKGVVHDLIEKTQAASESAMRR